MRRIILFTLLVAACASPDVAPGLDQYACDGGVCPAAGVIQGSVVYAGPARGDAILLLFDTASLPPPDGNGSSAVAVGRVPESVLFAGAPAGSSGPFSAPFSFAQVPSGRSYQIRALIDSAHEFDPFFDFTQSPRAGEPIGGYGEIGSDGLPHLLAIAVGSGQTVSGINVALAQTALYDPPAFTIVGAPALDQNMDRPVRLRLRSTNPGVAGANFASAHFATELSAGGKSTAGDGLPDVFPEVFLHQIRDASGAAVSGGAIIPCRAITTSILLALAALRPGDPPIAQDTLDLFVEPLAVDANLKPLPQIPLGAYQVVVVERTGQVWTVPNSLGDPARKGTPYYDASQGQSISVTASTLPPGGISGNVLVPAGVKSGNIIVQAYLDDPQNPPPPLGAALPVRVQTILGGGTGNVPYAIGGLPPGKYIVQALADADGNFSSLALLQTPSKGDLVGAVIDTSTLLPKSIAVAGSVVDGQDVSMAAPLPLDPPAFVVQGGAAGMPADSLNPARFTLQAQAFSFPTGSAPQPAFTVALVRDPVTHLPVDADGDGLPDVWPRVFLVRLDPGDASGLTQYVDPDTHQTATQVIPAAVDPTPFLPALLAGGPQTTLLATSLSVIARPVLIDATNPDAKSRRNLAPGAYKIVVINQTGQVWQMPNEAATAGVTPQGTAFKVSIPAALNAGSISGTLKLTGVTSFAGAYVFAYDANNPPPPAGNGTPMSADYHSALEFSGGSVNYQLQNLPADRSYLVAAVVDTRGDFAVSPQLFAAAPGEGTVLGQHLGLITLSGVGPAAGSVEVDAVASLATLPPRPSFVLRDASNNPIGADLTTLFPDAVTPQHLSLYAQPVLTSQVATVAEKDPAAFLVSFQQCVNGSPVDANFDNLPDLYPKVLVVKLSDADASGLTPDPQTTVIPAAIDPTRFPGLACGQTVPTTDLSVILSPVAVKFAANGTPFTVPIPAGRYGVVLEQSTGQVWRIPNELQPAMLDPRSAAAQPSLAAQGVSIRVAGQVPAAAGGSIAGVVNLSSYTPAQVGNLLVAAYAAAEPPPPLGTGRPVAALVVPRPFVQAEMAGGVAYQLANLPAGTYVVVAMLDPLDELSPSLSFMATPPRGAQSGLFGGAAPVAVTVGSAPVVGKNIAIDRGATPALPFERPAFSLAASSVTLLHATGSTNATLQLAPGTPAGLPYTVAGAPLGGGLFHPTASSTTRPNGVTCGGGASGPYPSSQVYVTPLDTGSNLVPFVQVDQCQFCPSLTGTADCSGTLLSAPTPMSANIVATVTNVAIDPVTKAPAGVPLPAGNYAITVVEATGQSWTLPNELGAAASAGQGAVFTVVTP